MSRSDRVRLAVAVAGLCLFLACWGKIVFSMPDELRPYAAAAWAGMLAAWLASRGDRP